MNCMIFGCKKRATVLTQSTVDKMHMPRWCGHHLAEYVEACKLRGIEKPFNNLNGLSVKDYIEQLGESLL